MNTDRRKTEHVLIDQALEIKIQNIVKQLPELTTSRLQIHSFNGHILLLGQTKEQDNIHLLSQKIAQIDGVKKIYNEMTAEKNLSFWQWSEDRLITSKIKGSMTLSKGISPLRVKVYTENSVVYLIGIVKENEEEVAVNIARNTSGVKKVVKIFERLS
jgi:osmotically-inducible protein OsmY